MEESSGEWLFIVNPNAGSRKGTRDWPKIERLIHASKILCRTELTTGRGHASELAQTGISQGFRKIAVVGGDGTLNEVVNGIFSQNEVPAASVTIGMIPVGTGNDWCRSFGIPFDYTEALELLRKGKTVLQDVGKVWHHYHDRDEPRFFINVAGMGYDALVAKKTNLVKEKGKGGPFTYFYFIFASLFQYAFADAVIEIDGNTVFKGEIFSMNVGVCKYSGGGMMQVPDAVPDDGLLDVTLIKKAPKYKVFQHAHKLYDGSHVKLPFVDTYRGRQIRIRSKGKIFMEADGESLGHSPFIFDVIPSAARVVTGH